jgi:hypothetical protein
VVALAIGAWFAAPRVVEGFARRAVDRLERRIGGTVTQSGLALESLFLLRIDSLAWSLGTDLEVTARQVEVAVDPLSILVGGRGIRSVEAGGAAFRLGDPARPFAGPSEAIARLREVARPSAGAAPGDPAAAEAPGSTLPEVRVRSLAGRILLADNTITLAGDAGLVQSATSLDALARELSARLDVSVTSPAPATWHVEAAATVFGGTSLQAAEARVSPRLCRTTSEGEVCAGGAGWKDGEVRLLDASWRPSPALSVTTEAVAVRWDDVPPADPAALRLPASAPEALRAFLATRTVREVELTRPQLDLVLPRPAPDEPPPPPPAPAPKKVVQKGPNGENLPPDPRDGAFRKAAVAAFELAAARIASLADRIPSASAALPPLEVAVHGARIRFAREGDPAPSGAAGLANVDATFARDAATGRLEGRAVFECPELTSVRNELTIEADPAAGTATATLRGTRLPLAPYRDMLPSWLLADAETALGETDVTVALSRTDRRLSVRGRLSVARAGLRMPSVASVPLKHLDAGLSGSLVFDWGAAEIRIEEARATLGAIRVPFDATATALSTFPKVAVNAAVERVRAPDLVESIPPEAIPALEGVRLEGSFAATFSLEFDTRDLAALRLDFKPDVADLLTMDLGRSVNLELLRHEFTHRIKTASGDVVTRTIGPASPDWVPLAEVPKALVDALVTGEDSQFFGHRGFSMGGIRRSVQVNLERGGFYQGASTVSQQLVKNLFLSHEKTIARKVQEVFITWQLERTLPKDKILELYLNVIEWGPDVWGLRQAAMHYFGKAPTELSLMESAFLVSIIPGPRMFHTYFERGSLTPNFDRRVKGLVREMARRRMIEQDAADAVEEQTLRFVPSGKGGATGPVPSDLEALPDDEEFSD